MTPRALSFVAVTLLAVGASAASVAITRAWTIRGDDNSAIVRVSETPEGVTIMTWTNRFEERALTKAEAASLGRALLEAAGQPEKPVPSDCCDGFMAITKDAACETDLKLSGDPNTPDSVRKVLMENVKRCRTRRQEKALDRMTERMK